MHLFNEISIVGSRQEWIAEAVAKVEAIDRKQMMTPDLAGRLEHIAAKYALDPALVIHLEKIEGVRRDVKRQVNDFGEVRMATVSVVDVSIPFSGDAQWFRFQPSHCTLIDTPVEIRGQNFVVTVNGDDPEGGRNKISRLITMINGNLETLKSEMKRSRSCVSWTNCTG